MFALIISQWRCHIKQKGFNTKVGEGISNDGERPPVFPSFPVFEFPDVCGKCLSAPLWVVLFPSPRPSRFGGRTRVSLGSKLPCPRLGLLPEPQAADGRVCGVQSHKYCEACFPVTLPKDRQSTKHIPRGFEPTLFEKRVSIILHNRRNALVTYVPLEREKVSS